MITLFQPDGVSPKERSFLIIINALCLGVILGSFVYSWLLFQPFALHYYNMAHSVEHLTGLSSSLKLLPELCLLKNLTGFPCPSCGMSRAMVMIVRGELVEAFRFNLMSLPLFFGAATFMSVSSFYPQQALRFLRFIGLWRGLALFLLAMLLAWAVKLTGSSFYW